MKVTKAEKRDAAMICNAYFDLFKHHHNDINWKPSALKMQKWIRDYRIREDYDLK